MYGCTPICKVVQSQENDSSFGSHHCSIVSCSLNSINNHGNAVIRKLNKQQAILEFMEALARVTGLSVPGWQAGAGGKEEQFSGVHGHHFRVLGV